MNDKNARRWNAESWDALTTERDRLASQLATEERASAYMGEQYNEAVTRLGAAEASLQEATRLLEEYRRWRLAGQHVGVMEEMLALDAGVENFLAPRTTPKDGEAPQDSGQSGNRREATNPGAPGLSDVASNTAGRANSTGDGTREP